MSEAISNSGFARALIQYGAEIMVSTKKQAPAYPNDAGFCALSTGEMLFHSKKVCELSIMNFYGNRFIHTNQGYAKCAVCLLNTKAAICADSGLAAALVQAGFDVLKIPSGGIVLSGYNEGFIGGASVKIAPDKLAFTGVFKNEQTKLIIEKFLRRHNITPIYLTDKEIFDIGSIIPIIEK
ncbi:MAG: hypothetical protein KBI01_09765 [Oscillospiraceae bacterium]|nr:hypothetical protein [Oscillospiraceae bacterium]